MGIQHKRKRKRKEKKGKHVKPGNTCSTSNHQTQTKKTPETHKHLERSIPRFETTQPELVRKKKSSFRSCSPSLPLFWYKGSRVEPLARSGASPLGVAPRSRLATLGAGVPRPANGQEALLWGGELCPLCPGTPNIL